MTADTPTVTPSTWHCAKEWWNAVDTAGFGFYSAASRILVRVMKDCQHLPSPDRYLLTSLCSSTQASWERQCGQHLAAAELDEQAIQLVRHLLPQESTGLSPELTDYLHLVALADALTGRAADSLGQDVPGDAAEWLAVGDDVVGELQKKDFPAELSEVLSGELPDAMWGYCGLHSVRAVIRHSWVRAEVAIAEGRWEDAQVFSSQAVDLATQWFSPRHQVKSLMVNAAAQWHTAPEQAAQQARQAYSAAQEAQFMPLEWGAAMLLASLPGEDTAHWEERCQQLRKQLRERGAYYFD